MPITASRATSYIAGVPQEIIDLVMDNIVESAPNHTNAWKTLRTCALVNKTFHASAYRHLFANVDVVYDSTTEMRMSKLRKVLETNSSLISLIRSLTITLGDILSPHGGSLVKRVSTIYRRLQQSKLSTLGRSEESNIIWVLRNISSTRLSTLTVRGSRSQRSSWNQFPPAISTLLLSIAQSGPNLEEIILYNINDLSASLLTRTKGNTVSKISLINCVFLPTVNPPFRLNSTGTIRRTNSAPDLQNLRRLIIHGTMFHDFGDEYSTAAVTLGASVLPFPKLTFISAKLGSRQEAIILGQILTSNAPLLKGLRIAMYHSFESVFTAISQVPTERLAAIKHLSIFNVYKIYFLDELGMFLGKFADILRCPLLPATIRLLTLEISAHITSTRKEDVKALVEKFSADLGYLDQVLCDRIRYPSLTKLAIHLLIYGHRGNWCLDVATGKNFQLLRMAADGAVVVDIKCWFVKYS